jgi:hypothetical protein
MTAETIDQVYERLGLEHTDYCCGETLAQAVIIIPKFEDKKIPLRVSTAYFPHCGLIETWIFSHVKEQRSRQIFHSTKEEAVKVHNFIVENLREKFRKLDTWALTTNGKFNT